MLGKIWPILAVLAMWLLFASPFFTKGQVPFPTKYLVTFFAPWNASYAMPVKNNAMPDLVTQIYPWKLLTASSWKRGDVPLWNPYAFAGTPHAGNYQSAVFSPVNALYAFMKPLDAWSVMVLLQPLLAGLFMFLFLRELGASKPAAALGATAYMFGGFMTVWMAYATLVYAALFLPLALWGVAVFLVRGRWYAPAVMAFALALSFVSGHFQISLYVAAMTVCFTLYLAVVKRQWVRGGLLLIAAAAGIALAAPQILLTLDAYGASTRSGSFIKAEVIPWQYLITMFAPDFYGNPVTRNDWFGHYAEWASYVGVVPLLLALAAGVFVAKSSPIVPFFGLSAFASILLAYPTPLNDLLFRLRLPAISTSAASRIMVLLCFSYAAIAAFGLDALVAAWEKQDRKKLLRFAGVVVFLVVVAWLVVFVGKPFPIDKLAIAKRNLVLPTVFAFFGITVVTAGAFVHKRFRWVLVAGLVIITMFDLYRFSTKWMPFDPPEYAYPASKTMSYLTANAGISRVFGNLGGEVGNTYGLHLIEGYDAMYPGRYGAFIQAVSTGIVAEGGRSVVMFDKYGRYAREALELLGVRYIVHRLSDGRNVWAFPFWQYPPQDMVSVYRDEHYEVFAFNTAYPRAFLAGEYVVEKDNQRIIDWLFAPEFNRRHTLVLEQDPAILPKPATGSADIVSYTPAEVTVRTSSAEPQLLFLSDAYDPGWQATVDGKAEQVMRADFDFRAVAVPAGEHEVVFRYMPEGYTKGLRIASLASIVLFTLTAVYVLVIARRLPCECR